MSQLDIPPPGNVEQHRGCLHGVTGELEGLVGRTIGQQLGEGCDEHLVGRQGAGRVEGLRVDPASLLLGVRINIWTSGLAISAAIGVLIAREAPGRRPEPADRKLSTES